MKAFFTSFFLLGLFIQSFSQAIIPVPVKIQTGAGQYHLTASTTIGGSKEAQSVVTYFVEAFKKPSGYRLSTSGTSADIQFLILEKPNSMLGKEGYQVWVNEKGIKVYANTEAGLFYGMQTLLQLLPKEVESDVVISGMAWTIPYVTIEDYPRFGWRGLMLDVSRHFFSKEEVKQFIDQMARYKFNRLHWHLTDDNGWRIEIKSYPKLTSVGAWRVPRTGTFNSNTPPKPAEKATYGGFYTQNDIREVIQYAKERYIEILPEVDVPGHSMAAIAAYPELCLTKDTTIRVDPGTRFSTWYDNGTFEMHIDNTLNPTDEKVYQFLDKVFGEVASLFPFDYIHMGGDECYKGYWERDAGVQEFMKKNKIKDGVELQAYFNKRVNAIITSKKKKLIGWDEILEGGAAPDAAVMSWRGTKGGVEATQHKHFVVMSPAPQFYLDMMQGEPSIEAPVYNSSRLSDIYAFDVLAPGIDSTYVLGGQGNIWTEQIPTTAQLEYQTYPRAWGIAEGLWSPKSRRNWADFVNRVETNFQRMEIANVNYSPAIYDPIISVRKNSEGKTVVEMKTEVAGIDLMYTLDNAIPNRYHPRYQSPILLPDDADFLKVQSYRNGKPAGRLIVLKTEELLKRIKK